MRIVVAVDGSPASIRAARYAAALASRLKAASTITLLAVDQPLMPGVESRLGKDAVRKYHQENADYALRGARAALRKTRTEFRELQLIGLPSEQIIKACSKPKADLLVMGSNGRGASASALLGSVALKILSTSKVPVTIIR